MNDKKGAVQCSFLNIFQKTFLVEDEDVCVTKIVIPKIQRDYAQGRDNDDVARVRDRFLEALKNAIVEKPTTLDFVYGDIDSAGIMTPLDGQQRLTTLFLLHWYAAKKENIPEEQWKKLKSFTYETRSSATRFCERIMAFTPTFSKKLSDEIVDQSWFPLNWHKDPTISAMLVMLDAICEKFSDVEDMWEHLESNAITFYFLKLPDMGLTDELYIKMNSRGKALTIFEHFKAELEREIRKLDEKNGTKIANRISEKIDRDWTNLLWQYRNSNAGEAEDYIIDDEFLRYFKFICDIIDYGNDLSPQCPEHDVFDLLELHFNAEKTAFTQNLQILEQFFDCWCNIPGFSNPTAFLDSFMGTDHDPQKIRANFGEENIFATCLHNYAEKSGKRRGMTLADTVLLYAIVVYLQNQHQVSYTDFVRRIRIVNNLIQNSTDEVADRKDRNRMPAIFRTTAQIIITGSVEKDDEKHFNENQVQEEVEKIAHLVKNPGDREKLFKLEDHDLLKGQISIIGLENLDLVERFYALFECSWDKVDCALMTIGNYAQDENKSNRHQVGSSKQQYAWDQLFHKRTYLGFDNTKKILVALLRSCPTFDDSILDQIISDYLADCESKEEYPWTYYYVKYSAFRPGLYGKLNNTDAANNPYLYTVMQTKQQLSSSSYIPYLQEADKEMVDPNKEGTRLLYSDKYILCENAAYVVCKLTDDTEIDRINIPQNALGVDTQDRIILLKNYIQNM